MRIAPPRLSCVAALLLTLSACGSGTSSSSDGAATDGSAADGPSLADATPLAGDAPGADVASADGGPAMLVATIHLDRVFENCMPIVASDPLQVMGTLEIMNTGGVSVGPVTASEGILTSEGLTELGRFSLGSVQLDAIPPGGTRSVPLMKTAGSLMPANGCGSSCGMLVRVRVPITGANVPAGTIVSSPLAPLECAS